MKVICLQQNLQKPLGIATHVASSRTQLPILTNVLLSAKRNGFYVYATDLEVGIKLEISAKVDVEGEVAIPAKTLFEFISSLTAEKVTLTAQDTTLIVKTTNQEAKFLGIGAAEFPLFDREAGNPILELSAGTMRDVLSKVLCAVASDEVRPALGGVLVKNNNGRCVFVATDGYRLSFKSVGTKKTDEQSLIIPGRILKELMALLDKEDGDKKIRISSVVGQNQVRFTTEGNFLVGRLIEDEFPNFEKVIPTGKTVTITVQREELHRLVKTAAIFARENSNIVKVSVKSDGLSVSASSSNLGESEAFVPGGVKGVETEIAFNSRFLLEFLGSIEEEEIIIEMTGPLNPAVFKLKSDAQFLHLIMPIRLQE